MCLGESLVPCCQSTKPEQTLIFFDWDDTLCPSRWIQDQGLLRSFSQTREVVDDEGRDLLKRLEQIAVKLLTAAMKLGKVVIVTNAQKPWVEESCKKFLPGLMPLIDKIPVRYARGVHEAAVSLQKVKELAACVVNAELKLSGFDILDPKFSLKSCFVAAWEQLSDSLATPQKSALDWSIAPRQWKETAFSQELCVENKHFSNAISIGDAVYECDALHNVVSDLSTKQHPCLAKTAKLIDGPSIPELIQQLSVVHSRIAEIVQHDGNVDIEIDANWLDFDINSIETSI